MQYQAYHFLHKLVAPAHDVAELTHKIVSHPLNPFGYSPLGRLTAAVTDCTARAWRKYEKPGFQLKHCYIDGRRVDVTEEVCVADDFCHLVHFRCTPSTKKPRMLIVAPLSGHFASLLKPTVEHLLPSFDIFITDWLNARDVPSECGVFGFDDYVTTVIEFLQYLGPNTHVMAVCQPTVPTLTAVAVMSEMDDPAVPASMTLVAGPIDTRINPTEVNNFAETRSLQWFRDKVICTVPPGFAGTGRRVYPGFLQLTGFIAMNTGSHFSKYVQHFFNVLGNRHHEVKAHREFYDEYLAVLDMPADYYLETLERVFLDQHLAKGGMTYRGKTVNPSHIRKTALLTVEGEKDDICGLGQTEAAQKLCSKIPNNKRQHYVQPGVGHYGCFSGSRFRNGIAPRIVEFATRFEQGKTKVQNLRKSV